MATSPAEEAYRVLASRVLGYLRARGLPDAEDVLGEVFLHVARDLPGFAGVDDPEAVRRWVFTIARNRAVDAARQRARRPRVVRSLDPGDDERGSDAAVTVDGELVAALAELSEDQREVLALRFVADLPLADVARLTGRTPGAVKSLQHRGLENLRRAVSPPPGAAL